MNVLQLSSESSWRGGEQQIAYLIHELQLKGIIPLIAGRPKSSFSVYAKEQSWRYLPLEMRNSIDYRSALRLKKICEDEKIDLLHVHSSRAHGIAYLAYLAGNKTPIIVSRRVDFPPNDNFLSRHKYNIDAVKKIACVSEAIMHMVKPVLNQPEKCITIYSGIDHSKFKGFESSDWLRAKYNINKDTLLVGNTSAIAPHKDYFTFIETAKQFISKYQTPIKFFIIGTGPLEAKIKAYSSEKQMDEHIIFTGFLNNIHEVLPSLDIFFISSETEGLGTSILDAFACKIPVMATEAGGIPEIVFNGVTGLTAAVKDSEALAEQLYLLISDKKLQQNLVEAAYTKSLALDKTQMAHAYFDIYKNILAYA